MLGLTRDFIQQGGTFMVLSDGAGIRSEELSKVEVSMISASKIPHLLPLYIKEVDLQVTLRYAITDKRMLSHMLKSEKINMTEYYGLLLQVAEALEESGKYMLETAKYSLDEDYMFVDGSLQAGTLYLTYIPLERTEGVAVNERLKELVTRFMASVTELSGGGVQQLLQYTSSEAFTLGGFRKLLLRLLSGEDNVLGESVWSGKPAQAAASERSGRAAHASFPGQYGEAAHASSLHGGAAYASFPDRKGGTVHAQFSDPSRLQLHVPTANRDGRAVGAARAGSYADGRYGEPAQPCPEWFGTSKGRSEPTGSGLQADHASDRATFHGQSAAVSDDTPISKQNRGRDGEQSAFDFFRSRDGFLGRSEESKSDEEAEAQSASSRKIYVALGCLLAAALVWRMAYMPAPSSGKMMLCLLLTIILAVVAGMAWKGKLFASKRGDISSASFDELPDFGSIELSSEGKRNQKRSRFEVEQLTGFFRGGWKKGKRPEDEENDPEPEWKWKFPPAESERKGMSSSVSSVAAVPEPENALAAVLNQRMWEHLGISDTAGEEMDGRDYYGQLGMKTEMLKPGKGGATVLLSDTNSDGPRSVPTFSSPVCYLLREGEGGERAERIELRQQHFVIGRSEEVSQYVETSIGASRAHVELSRSEDGKYVIKDLGSKNGTRLGGEAMVPYKEYPIHDGDTFVIVNGRYTFRSA
ncbi:DUF6382 domain-containing protein [Paenibacillus azoreducens]|uniref:DUF6382 domain-containing protein n=1 Tax=Paenibacillus azoreducens TaxID=116718 RepID=UPI0039F5A1AF